jgi:hypothetical protein
VFLENLAELQRIFHCWNPNLRIAKVYCETGSPQPGHDRCGCFYSGGVDSNYTLISNLEDVSDLIMISGFDFMIEPEAFELIIGRYRSLAGHFGKNIVPVETNFFVFEKAHRLSRNVTHGSCLAGVALALGLRKVYVPASYSYNELGPWGSHPLTDPLWSNGSTDISHHGAGLRRSQKLAEIVRFPKILENLAVCWKLPGQNCGVCDKCLRTMTALRLLGISCPTLPPLRSPKQLRGTDVHSHADLSFVTDNLSLAVAKDDREVEQELRRIVRRYQLREAVAQLDRAVFRSFFRRLYRRIRPIPPDERIGFSSQPRVY